MTFSPTWKSKGDLSFVFRTRGEWVVGVGSTLDWIRGTNFSNYRAGKQTTRGHYFRFRRASEYTTKSLPGSASSNTSTRASPLTR